MSFEFISESIGKSRRETLVKLVELFDDPEALKGLLGENVLLDATICLLAKGDPELEKVLEDVFDVTELLTDIKHVQNHKQLKQLISEKMGGS